MFLRCAPQKSKLHYSHRIACAHIHTFLPDRMPTTDDGQPAAASGITVGVRVRPFNDRERRYDASNIIVMNVQEEGVVRVKVVRKGTVCEGERPKEFQFDHAFWSHSRDGSATHSDCPFVDQQGVFQSLGIPVVQNVLEGFNSSLFAYGQTGSGKTYSMLGFAGDEGLTPRVSQHLFGSLTEMVNDGGSSYTKFIVECSYLEIYNEQVMDLLTESIPGVSGALKVRQHPSRGVFVEGLRACAVHSHEDVLALLSDGDKRRRVAQTNMNATSSRSHAMLLLNVTMRDDQGTLTRTSKLSMVDLAGSERASSTGAEGDTLVEGANINRSLTVLGMCLDRLADQASAEQQAGKGKKQSLPVPYRDSQLTFLLSESLGGNAKSTMLANISPADVNADETLSTLRFAQVAKRVKSKAVVNETAAAKLIRELKSELSSLKKHLSEAQAKREQAVVAVPRPRQPEIAHTAIEETNAPDSGSAAGTMVAVEGVDRSPHDAITGEAPAEVSAEVPEATVLGGVSEAHNEPPSENVLEGPADVETPPPAEPQASTHIDESAIIQSEVVIQANDNEQALLQEIEDRMKALRALQNDEDHDAEEPLGSVVDLATDSSIDSPLYGHHSTDDEVSPLQKANSSATSFHPTNADSSSVFVDWSAPQVVCMNEYVDSVVLPIPNGRGILAIMSATEWHVQSTPGGWIDLTVTFSPIVACLTISRKWAHTSTLEACSVTIDGAPLVSPADDAAATPQDDDVIVPHNARLAVQWSTARGGTQTRHAMHFRFSNVMSLPSAPVFSTSIDVLKSSPQECLRHLMLLETFGRLTLEASGLEALVAECGGDEVVFSTFKASIAEDRQTIKKEMFFIEEQLSCNFRPTSQEVAQHLRIAAAASKQRHQHDNGAAEASRTTSTDQYQRIAGMTINHATSLNDDDDSDGEDGNEERQMKSLFEEVDALREATRLREEEQQQTHTALKAKIEATSRERRHREQSIMVRRENRPMLRKHVDVMEALMSEVNNENFSFATAAVALEVAAEDEVATHQAAEEAQRFPPTHQHPKSGGDHTPEARDSQGDSAQGSASTARGHSRVRFVHAADALGAAPADVSSQVADHSAANIQGYHQQGNQATDARQQHAEHLSVGHDASQCDDEELQPHSKAHAEREVRAPDPLRQSESQPPSQAEELDNEEPQAHGGPQERVEHTQAAAASHHEPQTTADPLVEIECCPHPTEVQPSSTHSKESAEPQRDPPAHNSHPQVHTQAPCAAPKRGDDTTQPSAPPLASREQQHTGRCGDGPTSVVHAQHQTVDELGDQQPQAHHFAKAHQSEGSQDTTAQDQGIEGHCGQPRPQQQEPSPQVQQNFDHGGEVQSDGTLVIGAEAPQPSMTETIPQPHGGATSMQHAGREDVHQPSQPLRRQRMTTIIADDAIDDEAEGLMVPMHENSMFIEGAGVGSGFTPLEEESAQRPPDHQHSSSHHHPGDTSQHMEDITAVPIAVHNHTDDGSQSESVTSPSSSTEPADVATAEEELRWLQAVRDAKQTRPNGPAPRDHPEAAEDLGLWQRYATDPKEKLPFLREILNKQLDYYWARCLSDVLLADADASPSNSSFAAAPPNTSFFASVAAPLTATTRSTTSNGGSEDALAVSSRSKRLLPPEEQRAGYLWKLNQGISSHKWEYRFAILSGRFLYYFYSADGTCRCLAALYLYGAIISAVSDQLEGKSFVVHIQTAAPRRVKDKATSFYVAYATAAERCWWMHWFQCAATPALPPSLRRKLELEVVARDYTLATCATIVPGTSPHWLIAPSKWPSVAAEASPVLPLSTQASSPAATTDSFSGLLKEKHLHWTPDESALACSGCSQPFSFFRRRHHCRACGLVFCDACTKTVDMLNERNEMKKKRACTKCVAASISRIGRGSLLDSDASTKDRSESLVAQQGAGSTACLTGQSPVQSDDTQFAV